MALLNLGLLDIWAVVAASLVIGVIGIFLSMRGRRRLGGGLAGIAVLFVLLAGAGRYLSALTYSNFVSLTALSLAVLASLGAFLLDIVNRRVWAGIAVLWTLWFGVRYVFPDYKYALAGVAVLAIALLALGERVRGLEGIVARLPV